jgi:F0F1-type ATP synthase delta subunit
MSDRMMATVDSWILEYAASKGRHSALLCGVIPFFQDKKTLAQLGTSSLRNNFNILAALLEEGTTDGMLKSFTDYTFDSIRQLFVNINSLLLKQKRNSNFKQVQQAFQKLVLTTYRFVSIEIFFSLI